jgi:hypothetical protein
MTDLEVAARLRTARAWSAWPATWQSTRAALWPFLVSRAIVLGALLVARLVVVQVSVRSRHAIGSAHAGLLGWDATWYRRIATLGYGRAGRSSVRFFPLYPLLARAVTWLPGVGAGAALLIVSNIAALAAFALIHRLVLVETGEIETAWRSTWWLALFPAAFVLAMGYADSLLLVTSLAMFLALRTRHFAAAAVAGLLAGACRPVGVFLALPALIEAARGWREVPGRQWWWRVAAVVAAPVATLGYLTWSKVHDGSFLLPISAQVSSHNRGGIADPFVTIAHDTVDLVHDQHLGTALHAPWAIVFVVLAIVLFRRWPSSYGAYATLTLAVTLTAPNLTSFERYSLGCFPFALAAASLTQRRDVCWAALALSGALLAGYALLAFLGIYIP